MTIPDLYQYSELSLPAKANARACVLYEQEKAYYESLSAYKLHRMNSCLNARINAGGLKRLTNALAVIRRYQSASVPSLEKLIEENLCRFDDQGNQFLFLTRSFVRPKYHAQESSL